MTENKKQKESLVEMRARIDNEKQVKKDKKE